MSEAYLAIFNRAQAARDYCLGWVRRMGDIRPVRDEYDANLQSLRNRIEDETALFVRGGAPDEIRGAVTRLLGFHDELKGLEFAREATRQAEKEKHGWLLEVRMAELLGELTCIIRPPWERERESGREGVAHHAPDEGTSEYCWKFWARRWREAVMYSTTELEHGDSQWLPFLNDNTH